MIMTKFQKRITKLSKNCQFAIVVGTGFGYLEELLDLFDTVFVIADQPPSIKTKNLVYRENFEMFEQMPNINFMFYDRDAVDKLDRSVGIWSRSSPMVIIEGEEVIGRDLSRSLYGNGYVAVHQETQYHVWRTRQ